MMRSQSHGDAMRIGPMLAAGLTLRHYAAFRNCPSLSASSKTGSRASRPGSIDLESMSWSPRTAGVS